MSCAKECPFVLSFDAVANLETVFKRLSEKSYCAAPGSDHTHFRPEFHLPTQILGHAYKNSPTNGNGHRGGTDFITGLFEGYVSERSMTKDGDVAFGVKNPYIRLVADSDHGIHRDPTVYGEDLVATQLVIAHAKRLSDLLSSTRIITNSSSSQIKASGKFNVTIVTNYPPTIAIALAEGFQTWNYSSTNLNESGATHFECLLMDLGLVELDSTVSPPIPKLYKTDKVPPGSSPIESAPGWFAPD